MDERQAWFSLRDELLRQLAGIRILASELQLPPTPERLDQTWSSIQSLVISLNLVSSLLWPPEPKKSGEAWERWLRWDARAKRFRDQFGVSRDTPLNSPTLRNHVAHIDERIHQWVDELDPRAYVISTAFFSPHHEGFQKNWPDSPLRNFDIDSWTLFIYGDTFELRPMISAAADLEVRLKRSPAPFDLFPDELRDTSQ